MTASTAGARPLVDQIGYTRCLVPTASGIAIDRGLFAAEFERAITASSLRASPDLDVRESHYDHRQPVLFREGGNVPALWVPGPWRGHPAHRADLGRGAPGDPRPARRRYPRGGRLAR